MRAAAATTERVRLTAERAMLMVIPFTSLCSWCSWCAVWFRGRTLRVSGWCVRGASTSCRAARSLLDASGAESRLPEPLQAEERDDDGDDREERPRDHQVVDGLRGD